MSGSYEAFKNALEASGRIKKVQKAQDLQDDIETLYNTPDDAPDSLKEDIAALCDCSDYEKAQAKLERL
ncbi:hypothetical protein [Haloarcula marismortui]|jgi:hypothetical protein|uniref:Uncharacterized protein n=1 Tax=Haloarcula marismortui ATCC 33800 TaxID=662476 RepID=M0K6Q9_9EURY|nr:hypothetical protein [Haloarcula sinaiiensis]EMA15505.1 hypothetical protein C436_03191 [Haloarcula sinaiiensis ATCC 33800]QUJ72378.1 hypothetical protein KDQ40_01090 [Haloarcula sinaiiensis ATCC 33800]